MYLPEVPEVGLGGKSKEYRRSLRVGWVGKHKPVRRHTEYQLPIIPDTPVHLSLYRMKEAVLSSSPEEGSHVVDTR